MESIIKIAGPFIAALAAFIGAMRAFFWASERLEGFVSKNLREKLIVKLTAWWDYVEHTKFPQLAKREAQIISAKIEDFKRNDHDFFSYKLNLSFLLTTTAFLLGAILQVLSHLFDLEIEVLDKFINKDSLNYISDWNFGYQFYLEYVPTIILFFQLYRSLGSTKNRRRLLTTYLFHFLVYSIYVFVLISFFEGMVNTEFDTQTGDEMSLTNGLPRSFIVVIFLIQTVLLGLLHWWGTKSIRRTKKFTFKLFLLSLIIIVIAAILLEGSRYTGWQIVPQIVYLEGFYYFVNYLFDSLTFFITLHLIDRIANGGTLKNFGLILADISIATLLAVGLYLLTLISFALMLLALKGYLLGGENWVEIFANELSSRITFEFSSLRFGTVFFAGTTLIPTLVYVLILVTSYFSKLTYLLSGKLSKFFFYKGATEEQKSPVYMTLVLISTLIAIIPAYIAWISAKGAIAANLI